jgi:hypothetical protein
MVHPAIHAILVRRRAAACGRGSDRVRRQVTPICPRSLSFRPTIFPIDAVVTLKVRLPAAWRGGG